VGVGVYSLIDMRLIKPWAFSDKVGRSVKGSTAWASEGLGWIHWLESLCTYFGFVT
jgi:hypothetical protein